MCRDRVTCCDFTERVKEIKPIPWWKTRFCLEGKVYSSCRKMGKTSADMGGFEYLENMRNFMAPYPPHTQCVLFLYQVGDEGSQVGGVERGRGWKLSLPEEASTETSRLCSLGCEFIMKSMSPVKWFSPEIFRLPSNEF